MLLHPMGCPPGSPIAEPIYPDSNFTSSEKPLAQADLSPPAPSSREPFPHAFAGEKYCVQYFVLWLLFPPQGMPKS